MQMLMMLINREKKGPGRDAFHFALLVITNLHYWYFNPIAFRMAFGHSECNRVNNSKTNCPKIFTVSYCQNSHHWRPIPDK